MIIDPETKLIVSLVVGRRNADTVVQVFTDFYDRTKGCLPELIWKSPTPPSTRNERAAAW